MSGRQSRRRSWGYARMSETCRGLVKSLSRTSCIPYLRASLSWIWSKNKLINKNQNKKKASYQRKKPDHISQESRTSCMATPLPRGPSVSRTRIIWLNQLRPKFWHRCPCACVCVSGCDYEPFCPRPTSPTLPTPNIHPPQIRRLASWNLLLCP